MYFIRWNDFTFLGGTDTDENFYWSTLQRARSFESESAARQYINGLIAWEERTKIVHLHPLNIQYLGYEPMRFNSK